MTKLLKKLFWETNADNINLKKNANQVIEKILELGDIEHVKWMQQNYPQDQVTKVLISSRNLSRRSANFWADYFKVPKNRIKCLIKQLQKTQKVLWPY